MLDIAYAGSWRLLTLVILYSLKSYVTVPDNRDWWGLDVCLSIRVEPLCVSELCGWISLSLIEEWYWMSHVVTL